MCPLAVILQAGTLQQEGQLEVVIRGRYGLLSSRYRHDRFFVNDLLRQYKEATYASLLTSQATARHMVRQNSGVILIFGGEGDPMPDYYLGGTLVASTPKRPCVVNWRRSSNLRESG